MRYAIIVLALLGVLASPRPTASAVTGKQLLSSCPANNKSFCGGYALGWIDAFKAATLFMYGSQQAVWRNPKFGVCLPSMLSNGHIKRVIRKYLRAHPEKRPRPSAELTLEAMREAFPCR